MGGPYSAARCASSTPPDVSVDEVLSGPYNVLWEDRERCSAPKLALFPGDEAQWNSGSVLSQSPLTRPLLP